MNDGPAETGTPGQPGETLPPAAGGHAPYEGAPVADVGNPTNPNEWPAPHLDTMPAIQSVPAAIAPNGYAPTPIPYPPDASHAQRIPPASQRSGT